MVHTSDSAERHCHFAESDVRVPAADLAAMGPVMSAPTTSPADGRAVDWGQVYLDALAIEKEAPGTVCLTQVHYVRDHRHPIPYRMGFSHHYGMPNHHWHRNELEYEGCDE